MQDCESDWLHEAMMMSQIYHNAIVNVSADSGIDSRAGCFVERNPLDITPIGISSPQLSQSWKLLPVATHLFEWMAETSSFSRAWIHRERQLARRVLHFTDKELIWECCGIEGTSFASEMLPGGAPFKHNLFGSDHKYQVSRLQQGLVDGEEETYATWNDICQHLSRKNLTKPSDMPVVLSGLAKDFAHLLPAEKHVAGLWRSTLPQSLLWHTRSFKCNDLEYIAPSWSWLSTGCAVTLANRSYIERKAAVATILDISIELKNRDEYGPVSSGTLVMGGVLRRVQLSFEVLTNNFSLSVLDHEGGNGRIRTVGSSWDNYQGDMCTLDLDAPLEGPLLDCLCLFVTIEQWSDHGSHRDIACLVLKTLDKKGAKYARIGTLVLGDLYALKMRYRLQRTITEKDWKNLQKHIASVQDQVVQVEKECEKERGEGKAEDEPSDDTGGPILDAAQGHRRGLDALYQFDDTISHIKRFERLSPQTINIV